MKNNYLSIYDRPSLSQLFQERIGKIPSLVNNLKFRDVEEDEDFEITIAKIKDAVLLKPVVFDEPTLKDYEYDQNTYIYEVRFPFVGDSKLFVHTHDGMTYYSNDHGIVEPQSSKHVIVYAELSQLSPEVAISQAKDLFRLTKDNTENNSESVKRWNVAIEKRINDDLALKRSELFRIFGGK